MTPCRIDPTWLFHMTYLARDRTVAGPSSTDFAARIDDDDGTFEATWISDLLNRRSMASNLVSSRMVEALRFALVLSFAI
jgi:hypothetical protein